MTCESDREKVEVSRFTLRWLLNGFNGSSYAMVDVAVITEARDAIGFCDVSSRGWAYDRMVQE